MHYLPARPSPAVRRRRTPTGPASSASVRARSAATTGARAFTIGIGGPVGSGKTALLLALCRLLRDDYSWRS